MTSRRCVGPVLAVIPVDPLSLWCAPVARVDIALCSGCLARGHARLACLNAPMFPKMGYRDLKRSAAIAALASRLGLTIQYRIAFRAIVGDSACGPVLCDVYGVARRPICAAPCVATPTGWQNGPSAPEPCLERPGWTCKVVYAINVDTQFQS